MKIFSSYFFRTFLSQQDENGYFRAFGYFDLFQQAATIHFEEGNAGPDLLFKDDLIWVVSRNRIKVINNLKNVRSCIVDTWPHAPSKLSVTRDYVLKDGVSSKTLAIGSSLWCILNYKTRKITPISFETFKGDYLSESVFNDTFDKIPIIKIDECEKVNEIKVALSLYDKDHHVNNARYADWIYDSLPLKNKYISEIQIDYVNQSFLNDIIHIYKKDLPDNKVYVAGYLETKIIFKAIVEIKEDE